MKNIVCYLIAFAVFFLACNQDQPESETAQTNGISSTDKDSESLPTATPIPPPGVDAAGSNIKPVEQAPKEKLVYPKDFLDFGVPKFGNAKVENNIMLDNSQGKYGQRIKLACTASFEEVNDFYAKNLVKNGWIKNEKMDNRIEDEDVRFYSTNYLTSDESHTLLVAITELGPDNISVTQILKEN